MMNECTLYVSRIEGTPVPAVVSWFIADPLPCDPQMLASTSPPPLSLSRPGSRPRDLMSPLHRGEVANKQVAVHNFAAYKVTLGMCCR
jgi:hypothetical protein